MDEFDSISTKCGKVCQSIKSKLSGDNKAEYVLLYSLSLSLSPFNMMVKMQRQMEAKI